MPRSGRQTNSLACSHQALAAHKRRDGGAIKKSRFAHEELYLVVGRGFSRQKKGLGLRVEYALNPTEEDE